jgi:hypothetical protein
LLECLEERRDEEDSLSSGLSAVRFLHIGRGGV